MCCTLRVFYYVIMLGQGPWLLLRSIGPSLTFSPTSPHDDDDDHGHHELNVVTLGSSRTWDLQWYRQGIPGLRGEGVFFRCLQPYSCSRESQGYCLCSYGFEFCVSGGRSF